MFDSALDRALTYRLASAFDCWGHRRSLRCASRGGIWFLDLSGLDERRDDGDEPAPTRDAERSRTIDLFAASGRFTETELATLRALVIERLTFDEIAQRAGCTRQAVLARILGNSRRQGGILKKAAALLAGLHLHEG
jgi:hypothetical protein